MPIEEVYDRLAAAASLEGNDGAIRIAASFEPSAGPGTKVSPPTYPGYEKERIPRNPWDKYEPYAIEVRATPDGGRLRCVLLDSRQSQANRCEEALQGAIDAGRISLPQLVLDLETHGSAVSITSLTAPHRSRDAYFRDALDANGTRFDDTAAGQRLLSGDASAFYSITPADLVYGVWDSHRQRRIQTKFPRVYT
ncbi:MAG: type I-G CRISPR-associated RAMP protein Csb1/Cas7g, partial [Acidimicrobiales bacterium]